MEPPIIRAALLIRVSQSGPLSRSSFVEEATLDSFSFPHDTAREAPRTGEGLRQPLSITGDAYRFTSPGTSDRAVTALQRGAMWVWERSPSGAWEGVPPPSEY